MITNLDSMSQRFITDLARIQQTIARASSQVSSGKRIAVASDAPDAVEGLLQLRTNQSHNNQVASNLSLASAEASSADGALGQAIKLIDRALGLASEAASDTQTADTRTSIAQEIQALLEEMVACSQTAVQGRYIFSGDQSDSPAYTVNLASGNGVDVLSASAATRRVEDAGGGTFAATRTAQDIFDHRNADGTYAADNVFNALNSLRVALLAGNTSGITQAVESLQAGSGRLNSAQAFYGAVENRIQIGIDFAQRYDVELKTEISSTEDADIASAAMELTRANTQLQAAFTMRGRLPSSSLFNYLG